MHTYLHIHFYKQFKSKLQHDDPVSLNSSYFLKIRNKNVLKIQLLSQNSINLFCVIMYTIHKWFRKW